MWLFKKKKEYYKKLLKELETILIKNGVTPIHLFNEPKVLEYLTFYPYNHIYCFLKQKDINSYINEQERVFAKFIKKLGFIRKKSINLLLDTPSDYEYYYPSCVGWRDNTKYEEEIRNYQDKLAEYEEQKKIMAEKRKKLLKKPEFKTYFYVRGEYNKAKCPTCAGTGRIPSIYKKWGYKCYQCKGSGKTGYLPKVTAEQNRIAETFQEKLAGCREPEFTSFPRKKKSIFIRVVHGGQIFIIEK